MKMLAIEREVKGVENYKFEEHLREEAARVWQLHQSGVIREIYFQFDQNSAVLILECKDLEEANQVLQTLPLVREGLIIFEVIPLKAYPGFSRLFSS